jgi:hypothetical protein
MNITRGRNFRRMMSLLRSSVSRSNKTRLRSAPRSAFGEQSRFLPSRALDNPACKAVILLVNTQIHP